MRLRLTEDNPFAQLLVLTELPPHVNGFDS
jgi:hypothetical protein